MNKKSNAQQIPPLQLDVLAFFRVTNATNVYGDSHTLNFNITYIQHYEHMDNPGMVL